MGNHFFILGCERSGTTLLRLMLNNHPEIAVPDEAEAFSSMVSKKNPWMEKWTREEAQGSIAEILANPKVSRWAMGLPETLECLPVKDSYAFSDLIAAVYEAYAKKHGKKIWGDKTPINTFGNFVLIQNFQNAKFIHLVRDGRDVYLSWKKADWARYDLEKAAKRWKGWVREAYRYAENLGPERYMAIRFVDLVNSPELVLKRICAFLDVSYSDAMLDYDRAQDANELGKRQEHLLVKEKPKADRAFVWKNKLTAAERKKFDAIAAPVLKKYGYEIQISPIRALKPDMLLTTIKSLGRKSYETF